MKSREIRFALILLTVLIVTSMATAGNELTPQRETDHFIFYCSEQDAPCLNEFSKTLEDNYQRICTDLDYSFNVKLPVKIYPDLQTYHIATGRPNDPDWSVGSSSKDNIRMVSPLNPGPAHNYDSLLKVIVHEFTHVVVGRININAPKWLNEGIAAFEAGQMDAGRRKFLSTAIRNGRIPKLSDLQTDSISFGNSGGYFWSYTIVEMAVQDYGWPKVREWLRNGDMQLAFGINENEFQGKWVAFLKKNYR